MSFLIQLMYCNVIPDAQEIGYISRACNDGEFTYGWSLAPFNVKMLDCRFEWTN